MNKTNNQKLTPNAKTLRKNMTKEERHLWYDFLKSLPITFNRQKVIGNYIVDFYCAKAKIVIELDGSQHYETSGQKSDKKRDEYLNNLGITVFRYSNLDINRNFRGVCLDILSYLSTSSTASGPPSPQGEG
ncbi:MAG: endonuclease domain-containing protein [Clostridia bacterium]|nr:endonuclease domain-containing protein [Clostridia bacterium]